MTVYMFENESDFAIMLWKKLVAKPAKDVYYRILAFVYIYEFLRTALHTQP